jgi:FHA domain-containing protein/uncharacterized protein DUF1707
VPTEAPTPLPGRTTREERERAVQLLRESSEAGRISVDTYARRIERAWMARTRDELVDLTSDVRPRGRVARRLTGVVEAASALTAETAAAWRRPRLERLALPTGHFGTVTIGRGPACDCVVSHPTVSRRHAQLRPVDGGWELVDLGSTNGTRINGWRVAGTGAVRPGDEVAFGSARFRVGDRG